MTEFNNNISYPILLSGGMARLYLPKNITQNDADRVSKMLNSLVIEKTPTKNTEEENV